MATSVAPGFDLKVACRHFVWGLKIREETIAKHSLHGDLCSVTAKYLYRRRVFQTQSAAVFARETHDTLPSFLQRIHFSPF